jgi:hypothetical protein
VLLVSEDNFYTAKLHAQLSDFARSGHRAYAIRGLDDSYFIYEIWGSQGGEDDVVVPFVVATDAVLTDKSTVSIFTA